MQTIPSGEGHLLERRTLPPLSCTTAKMQPTKLPESLGTVYPEHMLEAEHGPRVRRACRPLGGKATRVSRIAIDPSHDRSRRL
jgi:hypothetical protein